MEEGSIDGKHLVISCKICLNNASIWTLALWDTGASSFAFMDKEFASLHSVPLQNPRTIREIADIDGPLIDSCTVTHIAWLGLHFHGDKEQAPIVGTRWGHYPLVLGITCIQLQYVVIQFLSHSMTIGSYYYLANCTLTKVTPAISQGISIKLVECPAPGKITVGIIRAVAMKLLTKRRNHCLMYPCLYEISKAIEGKTSKVLRKKQIPTMNHEFLSLCDKKLTWEMPPHCCYNYTILLREGKEPPFGPPWGMSPDELITLREYIAENGSKAFILAS